MFLKNIFKLNKSIILCILLVTPGILLAFVNINFIPTENGMENLIVKEKSPKELELELTYIEDNQIKPKESNPPTITTSFDISRVIVIPISLKNTQITDKIIVIPTEKATSGEEFSTIYVMDANLQNSKDTSVTPRTMKIAPVVIKNNNGIFLICASHNNVDKDVLVIYKVDTDNNSVSQILSSDNYQDIKKIIPLDKNTIAIIEQKPDSKIDAHIYSISEQKTIETYTSLNTDSNLRIEYDPSKFQTKIVSDLDDKTITDAPSPYGIVKAY
ncbi:MULTISPECIES: hypothetical protein [unclassified Francisella]|uniref:hypothetical protein n=1 Tax=unclassified Francisella TaxID=2610885 RepID=UPI002E305AFD|nr:MULTISPECIES: hypothetical protein [unclassified Francisella]MED7819875.1 hypothetical protein [Francisella sp. 19S2-4]MED7830707.1 hypothetical protein [Francisella sp. 19S2-10]